MSNGIYSANATTIDLTPAFPTVTVTSTGTIYAASGNAVGGGSTGTYTLFNYGSIAAAAGDAISLQGSGVVTNGGSGDSTPVIYGGAYGVQIDGPGTVINYGRITGVANGGVYLEGGGSVTNAAGGTIASDASNNAGVYITTGAGTVVNDGYITGNIAVGFGAGGNVTNELGGTIVGGDSFGDGVFGNNSAVTVSNFGTISGLANAGIVLGAGGSVANEGVAATISGKYNGIFVNGTPGTVTNSGTITASDGKGVYLGQGGSVTNGASGSTAAYIAGSEFGVYIKNSAGTVTNFGTIAGGADAVTFNSAGGLLVVEGGSKLIGTAVGGSGTLEFGSGNGPGTASGLGGVTYSGFSTYEIAAGATWTLNGTISTANVGLLGTGADAVTNLGTIIGASQGIYLGDGSSVINGSSGDTTALIEGFTYGVTIAGTGTLANYGTIQSTDTLRGSAVQLATGQISNVGTAALIDGGVNGAFVLNGTVSNSGTIIGVHGNGVELGGRGSVSNIGTGSLIEGATGIFAGGGGGSTLNNAGTVEGTAGEGVYFNKGGYVTNSAGGLITGTSQGIYFKTGVGTVTNYGTITATNAKAVYLAQGGYVTNAAGGLIEGPGGGVDFRIAAGTVLNSGTINGLGSTGVYLAGASTIANLGTASLIEGGTGIYIGGNILYSTVSNAGTIDGTINYAIQIEGGGVVTSSVGGLIEGYRDGVYFVHKLGTVSNHGTIQGGNRGVYLQAGGAVTNSAGGLIEGTNQTGVYASVSDSNVSNAGTITGGTGSGGAGIDLLRGGTVANSGSAALISGYEGIYLGSVGGVYGGSISNTGTIESANDKGVLSAAVAIVSNTGTGSLIEGLRNAIYLEAGGTVTNSGTLIGTQFGGIQLGGNAGRIDNIGTGALITGAYGLRLIVGTHDTATNYGVIKGTNGTAVLFGSSTDVLVVEAGSKLVGKATGDGGTLIFDSAAGAGTMTGLGGATYSGFGTYEVATGASWTLTGANTAGVGATFENGGTLTVAGTVTVANPLYDAGTVVNKGRISSSSGAGGTAVQLASSSDVLVVENGSKLLGHAYGAGGALIFGSAGGAGTVSGLGDTNTTYGGFGVYEVAAGAHWTVGGYFAAGTTLINDGTLTVKGSVVSAGSIDNAGTFTGGITLAGNAALTNSGTVSVTGNAVYAGYDPGYAVSVTDLGRIVAAGANGIGVYLAGGDGTITVGSPTDTSALLKGNKYGVRTEIQAATVISYGTIQGSNGSGAGAYLGYGGGVTVGALGLVEGHYGVEIEDAAGTVVDYGVVQGVGGAGLVLANGGNVIVGSASDPSALLEGTTGLALTGAGTVINYGTIEGSGGTAIQFNSSHDLLIDEAGSFVGTVSGGGGTLELGAAGGPGTLSGLGTSLVGFSVIDVDPASEWTVAGSASIGSGTSLVNYGLLLSGGNLTLTSGGYLANEAIITAAGTAVHIASGVSTLVNAGTIDGTGANGAGISMTAGDVVTNQATGLIQGYYDAVTLTGGGTLFNDGTVQGAGLESAGIDLYSGGHITNGSSNTAALIAGYYGVFAAGGTIDNLGTISGNYVGIRLIEGLATNGGPGSSGALIEAYVGLRVSGGLLYNFGTIEGTGHYGVEFAPATYVPGALVVEGGSTIVGSVSGAGNILALGGDNGAGTMSGLGSKYAGFELVTVSSAATWTLFGDNDVSTELIDGGMLMIDGTLSVEGFAAVADGGTLENDGSIWVDGGVFLDSGVLLGAGTIGVSNYGTIDLATYVASAAVDFNDGSMLELAQGGSYGGITVADFVRGDTIDLTTVGYVAGRTVSSAGGHLILYGAGGTYADITAPGLVVGSGNHLEAVSDGGSGTNIDIVCFHRGTRILTDRGEARVEDLAPGDLVVTLSGNGPTLKPVRWLGHRRIDPARHVRPWEVHPVRICANAFAEGMPHRDLLLSPGHAVYVDGFLVPASQLVNGVTIRQDRGLDIVEYWHVELDSHDALLAEGLPAETYLDGGNRGFFENAGVVALHAMPAGDRLATGYCASWHDAGAEVAAVKRRLIERVTALGYALGSNADLRLEADGVVLRPIAVDGSAYRFTVPSDTKLLRLGSVATVPAETQADNFDTRRLGVAVSRIVLLDGEASREIAIHDEADAAQGWHVPERDGERRWRWTDGNAALPALGAGTLEVTVEMVASRWMLPEPDAADAHRSHRSTQSR